MELSWTPQTCSNVARRSASDLLLLCAANYHVAYLRVLGTYVQGHLEKLSENAKSIHHVLEALCGGLDRLERKFDTNSSQVRVLNAKSV